MPLLGALRRPTCFSILVNLAEGYPLELLNPLHLPPVPNNFIDNIPRET